jgi:hypothetical protein
VKKKLRQSVTALLSILQKTHQKKVGSDFCRAYTWDGSLLGILRFDAEKKQWQPEKVFN